jgi:hypothetical protein
MIDIHIITADIAERLSLITGETWAAELPAHRRDDMQIIVAERDQAEIEITHATYTHRFELCGSLGDAYNHRRHDAPPLRISVADHRPAVEIAKEIARRLLTSYRAELHEARRRKATYDTARAYEETIASELAALVNGGIYTYQEHKNAFHNGSTGPHLKAYVSHGYGVTFERISNVSVEAARRILAILKDEKPVRPE